MLYYMYIISNLLIIYIYANSKQVQLAHTAFIECHNDINGLSSSLSLPVVVELLYKTKTKTRKNIYSTYIIYVYYRSCHSKISIM